MYKLTRKMSLLSILQPTTVSPCLGINHFGSFLVLVLLVDISRALNSILYLFYVVYQLSGILLSSMKDLEFSPFNTSQFPTLSCNFDYFITYYIAYKNIFKLIFSWSINYLVKLDSLLGKMMKLVCLHFS